MKEMFSYLSYKGIILKDESDQSKMYQQKLNNWKKLWEHNLTKKEIEWINKKEIKSVKVFPNVKAHKENDSSIYCFS